MRMVLTGVQGLKSYTLLLVLGLLVGCQSWNLPLIEGSLTDGLVARYSFEGNTLDASGNNLTGQLINGATYGISREGTAQSALQLDGMDDYFEIPDDLKLRPDSITISLWLKAKQVVDDRNGTRHIYSKADYMTNDNQQYSAFMGRPRALTSGTDCCEIYVDVNNDGSCTADIGLPFKVYHPMPSFEVNKWYHLVTVYSGQSLRLYINGELKISQKENKPIDKCVGGNLRFGALKSTNTNNFDGIMDDIRIYNRRLTQAEITALYKQ